MKNSRLIRKTPMKRSGNPLARSRLSAVSKQPKKRKENALYERVKAQWWKAHDHRCEVMFMDYRGQPSVEPGPKCGNLIGLPYVPEGRCARPAMKQPHHVNKRGPSKCDITTFMGACFECHNWIHAHETKSRRLGYLTA